MKISILSCVLSVILLTACGGDNAVIFSDDPLINQEFNVCRSQGGRNYNLLVEVLETGEQFSVTYCDLERRLQACRQVLCKTGADCPNNCATN